jgi:hypothetical protein
MKVQELLRNLTHPLWRFYMANDVLPTHPKYVYRDGKISRLTVQFTPIEKIVKKIDEKC